MVYPGADITYSSPTVILRPDFSVKAGGIFKASRPGFSVQAGGLSTVASP